MSKSSRGGEGILLDYIREITLKPDAIVKKRPRFWMVKFLFTSTSTDVEVSVMKEKHNTTRRFVSYLRVSTERQGQSGLGLEAQRDSVDFYVRSQNGLIVREFVEIESGRRNNRPKFAEALALAGRAQATLVVAKLDRLSRDYDFLRRIINANVDFCAIDYPDANKLTLQIMAVLLSTRRR